MDEFIQKVAEMRRLQKQYFSSRDPHTLQACKKLEREVDAYLEFNKAPSHTTKAAASQPSLFQ